MGVVVDSSIFIAAERGRFDWTGFHAQLGEQPLYLAVVTLAELLHGAERAIAAIARRSGFRVATLNGGEFRRVPNLEVIDGESFRQPR
jgi:predicted nucleic acid-binding protein